MVDRCVCCGEIVPEGRMVCYRCQYSLGFYKVDKTKDIIPISGRYKKKVSICKNNVMIS